MDPSLKSSNILAQISDHVYFVASNVVKFKAQIKTSDRSYVIFFSRPIFILE